MVNVQFKEIATATDEFLYLMRGLKEKVGEAEQNIRKIKVKSEDLVKITETELSSPEIITTRNLLKQMWPEERRRLEDILMNIFVGYVVPAVIDVEKNPLLKYSIDTEGVCLTCRDIKIDPIGTHAKKEGYRTETLNKWIGVTYEKLRKDWPEHFVLDSSVAGSSDSRDAIAPRCKEKKHNIPTMLLSTRHVIQPIDVKGPIMTAEARSKTGESCGYKVTELLTGYDKKGEERTTINDLLSIRLRSGPKDTWIKGLGLLRGWKPQMNWGEVIWNHGYNPGELDESIMAAIGENPALIGFYNSRLRNAIVTEKASIGVPGEDKHLEIHLPCNRGETNKIELHICRNGDYSQRESTAQRESGEGDFSDVGYKIWKNGLRTKNYPLFNWLVLKHVAMPIVLEDYQKPVIEAICNYHIKRLTTPQHAAKKH